MRTGGDEDEWDLIRGEGDKTGGGRRGRGLREGEPAARGQGIEAYRVPLSVSVRCSLLSFPVWLEEF